MYKLQSGILTDRLYTGLAERYGLIDSSQEGFRRLHSTQRQVLSSLRLGLVFNCLLLVLRATGIAPRLMTGLRTPAQGFADDDLVLCTESPEDMKRSEASGYTNSRQSSCTTLSVN